MQPIFRFFRRVAFKQKHKKILILIIDDLEKYINIQIIKYIG